MSDEQKFTLSGATTVKGQRQQKRLLKKGARQELRKTRKENNKNKTKDNKEEVNAANKKNKDEFKKLKQKLKDKNKEAIKRIKRNRRLKKKMCDKPIPDNVMRSLNSANFTISRMENVLKDMTYGDEEAVYDEEKRLRRNKLDIARTIYNNAPQRLRDAEEDYYNLSGERGGINYSKFQTIRVNEILKRRLEQYDDDFNRIKDILKGIQTETRSGKKEEMLGYLKDLKELYQSGATPSEKDVIKEKMNLKIAQRVSYYSEKDVSHYRLLNVLIHLFCITMIVIYVGYNVYFKSMFPWFMVPVMVVYTIILIVYFMLMDRGVFHYLNENNPSLGERFRNNMMILYMYLKQLGITKNAIPIGILCIIFAFLGYRYGTQVGFGIGFRDK